MGEQNWRQEITAGDFFGNQKKITQINDRRPVVRKPSDLVGPGIAAQATRITDFNDALVTYNGYFSADVGAAHSPAPGERLLGFVVSDSQLGGWQEMRSLDTGVSYRRTFKRAAYDSSVIHWRPWLIAMDSPPEPWIWVGGPAPDDPEFQNGWANYGGAYPPARFKKIGGVVYLDGLVANPSGDSATIFVLPLGYRPTYKTLYPGVIHQRSTTSGPASAGTAHTHVDTAQDMVVRVDIGDDGVVSVSSYGIGSMSTAYLSLSGISFPVV